MDILNFLYLKRAELIKAQVNDSATDLIVLGAEVPFTTRDDGYQVYGMTVDDFKTAVLPTLQEVLDFNHDLVDGNNFQGTGAGVGNTGTEVIAIGTNTANGNTGNNVVALGTNAGIGNPLSGMFIIANTELPSYANYAAASAAISPTGIVGNTYLYHDQATNAIGAVRL